MKTTHTQHRTVEDPVATTYELEGESLEDAIRQLITQAAGGDVDITLRTRGYDPRRTGPTSLHASIDTGGSDSNEQSSSATASAGRTASPTKSVEELDEEADVAADFIEGLLDAMDVAGDISIKVLDDAAIVEVIESDSGALIGRRGQVLEAIQEITHCTLQRDFDRRTRVRIDIEGYRERRLEKLLDKADEVIDDVLADGGSIKLEPMDVFERKAVHELVSSVDGVTSNSVGREPGRRVVIEAGR